MLFLLSSLNKINSLTFFPLENAKEEVFPNNSFLIFNIKGAIDSAINNNLSFLIESSLYKDDELLFNNSFVNCSIPKLENAKFGTNVIAKCKIDLYYSSFANKILFSKFIFDSNLKVEDPNNFILNKNLEFTKNFNITPNYEYVVEDIKFIKCLNNKYIFGILGEIDKIFVSTFNFSFNINQNSAIIADCVSPFIYFTKKTMINCTIIINDNNLLSYKNGIQIRDRYYKIIDDEGEKILKIKIGNNQNKLELKELSCNDINNIISDENNLNTNNITKTIQTEENNINSNETKYLYDKNNHQINNKNITQNLTFNNKTDNNKNISLNISPNFNNTEKEATDRKENNITYINNSISDNKELNDLAKENKEKNKTDEINSNNNNLTEKIEKDIKIAEKNETKQINITNPESNNTLKNNSVSYDSKVNNTDLESKEIINKTKVETIEENSKNESNNNLYKNISNESNETNRIKNEESIKYDNSSNYNISKNISTYIEKINRNYSQENINENSTTDKLVNSSNIREIRRDEFSNFWKNFGNRGKNFNSNKNESEIEKEEKRQREWERQKEEEKKRKKEEEELIKEEERKKKEQEEIIKMIRERQEKEKKEIEEKIKKEEEENKRRENLRKRNFENITNNQNDYKIKDNNINVKLIHIQIKFSFDKISYLFYSLTPIPKGHQIKINLQIFKFDYISRNNMIENKSIILMSEQEINKEDDNIIIEYTGNLECRECKKIILDKNNIEGATIYNIPEDENQREAIFVGRKKYISKFNIKNPLLYITERVSNKNCLVNLQGNFFNKNRFFPSKFSLILINNGNSFENKNITISCGLNERSIFECPIEENLKKFEFTLEKLIINKKENIIIDNSLVTGNNMVNQIYCNKEINKIQVEENNLKNNNKSVSKKMSKKKRIIILLICLIILLYLLINCCCEEEKEPEYKYSSSSSGSISNRNYVGETSGLINRRW